MGYLKAPFLQNNRINEPLVLIFVALNIIVAVNAAAHHPMIGYDAVGHLRYVEALSEFRLPTSHDTKEFFSPPLPYVLPALTYALIQEPCEQAGIGQEWGISETIPPCVVVAAKVGLWQNVLFSLGLTFYLIKLCRLLRPDDALFPVASLLLLAVLPVYYKTFAFIRGEPVLAFLAVLTVYHILALMFGRTNDAPRTTAAIGVGLGLLLLSRQWAFALFPATALLVVLWVAQQRAHARPFVKTIAVSFGIAALCGAWFYGYLKVEEGKATAFNREPAESFSFANQPAEFYRGTGDGDLFRNPIRPSFQNQLLPTFYAEMWGDYWCYFSVNGCGKRRGFDNDISNKEQMRPYLAMVNRFALLPTLLLLAGVGAGFVALLRCLLDVVLPRASRKQTYDEHERTTIAFAFFQLIILVSLAGYLWFLISYPRHGNGDTIKATYMLHLFPLTAIMAGAVVQHIRRLFPPACPMLLVVLVLLFFFNIPTMITQYPFSFPG